MKYVSLLMVLIMSFYACNNSTITESSKLNQLQTPTKDFDGPKELSTIDNSINNGTMDSITVGDNAYWFKNGRVVKLYLLSGYGGRFEVNENYYFKEDGQVFAYQKEEINSQGFQYRVLFYFNGSNVTDGYYWFNKISMDKREMEINLKKIGYSLKDMANVEETKRSKGQLTISELTKENGIEISSEKMNEKTKNKKASVSLKPFTEVQLTLMDGSLKKAKLYLGEPDKYVNPFGHITKGYAVYFNKVSNNGKPQHLVLFLRMSGNFWGDDAKIEEMYSVGDDEKACFGIHCLYIDNKLIHSNVIPD
jgi:hypothetical protein